MKQFDKEQDESHRKPKRHNNFDPRIERISSMDGSGSLKPVVVVGRMGRRLGLDRPMRDPPRIGFYG